MPVPVNIVAGAVNVVGISGTTNVAVLSGTITLPAGASTSDAQDTGNASLANVDAATAIMRRAAELESVKSLTGMRYSMQSRARERVEWGIRFDLADRRGPGGR